MHINPINQYKVPKFNGLMGIYYSENKSNEPDVFINTENIINLVEMDRENFEKMNKKVSSAITFDPYCITSAKGSTGEVSHPSLVYLDIPFDTLVKAYNQAEKNGVSYIREA